MKKRFGVRKIKIGSYSRQGWLMSSRESFAVYDSMWKDVAHSRGCSIYENSGKRFMYVEHTMWNNRNFVQALADWLNENIGADVSKFADGWKAQIEVIQRDVGLPPADLSGYHVWCEKFSTGFRPVEKFQKV